jgi:hypothetical protein
MNWRSRLISLAAALISLCSSLPVSFAAEPTGEDQYGRLLFEHPAPELSSGTWKTIQTRQKGSIARLTGKLLISVDKGVTRSVTVEQSTGFKPADDEIVHWIQTKWQFRPEITHFYRLPVYVIPPKVTTAGTRTIGKPLIVSKSEIAEGVTIKSQKMIISVEVDHGTITKIGVSRSTGDPKLDTAAVRWVKENWVFKKDLSGQFQLPVEFSKKE